LKKKTLEEKVKLLKEKTFYQEMQVKEIQTNDDESLSVSGYFNRYKLGSGELVKDSDGDSILPSDMSLERYKINPIILANHRHSEPIGVCTELQLRDDGVWGVAKIYKKLDERMYNAVKLGVVKTFSIGFSVGDVKYLPEQDLYLLLKTNLIEVSLVPIPANQYSYVESVNTGDTLQLSLSASKAEKLLDETNDNQEPQDLLKEVRDTLEVLKTFIQNNTLKEVETVDEIVKSEEDLEVSKESPEPKEVILDKEVVTEDNKEVEKETPNIEELISSTEVSEDNFNTLLQITENLQSKLNTFLQEHLN